MFFSSKIFIFEKINDFSDETDKEELLERIRISLARQISNSLAEEESKTIYAYELSEKSLESFAGEKSDDEVIKIESNKIEEVIKHIKEKVAKFSPDSKEVVIIAPRKIRHLIFLILSQMLPNVRVVAREELIFDYPLQIISRI